jgi:hypothetical protein
MVQGVGQLKDYRGKFNMAAIKTHTYLRIFTLNLNHRKLVIIDPAI